MYLKVKEIAAINDYGEKDIDIEMEYAERVTTRDIIINTENIQYMILEKVGNIEFYYTVFEHGCSMRIDAKSIKNWLDMNLIEV